MDRCGHLLYLAADPFLSLAQSGGAGTHMRATVDALERYFDVDAVVGGVSGDDTRVRRGTPSKRGRLRSSGLVNLVRRPVVDARRVSHARNLARDLDRRFGNSPPRLIYERSAFGSDVGSQLAAQWKVPHVLETDVTMVDLMKPKTSLLFRRLRAIDHDLFAVPLACPRPLATGRPSGLSKEKVSG